MLMCLAVMSEYSVLNIVTWQYPKKNGIPPEKNKIVSETETVVSLRYPTVHHTAVMWDG